LAIYPGIICHMFDIIIRFTSTTLLAALFVISVAHAELLPPPIDAKGYILIDAGSGDVLAEKNADEGLPPASLTKMMSDYVISEALQNGSVHYDDPVRISEKAWRMGGSKMFVMVGSDIALIDLLRGMIIQSGNDASIALAEHLAGSEEAFTQRMNQTAAELGMGSTTFRNATGWPDPEHRSTARDLAVLARAMINRHPEQYAFYAEKEFVWNDIKQPNRNLLLWRDSTVDGIKTGHTEEAGYCLVASAKREDMRLISVIMGAKSEDARAVESQKLLNFGFRNFESKRLYEAGSVLEKIRVWKGVTDQLDIGVTEAVVMTLPRGSQDKLQATVAVEKIIEAPIAQGQVLGTLTVTLDGKTILTHPVTALNAVEQGNFFTRLWDSIKLFFLNLMGGI
jgi:D-alanyl-D-alanine carboxypeptidase (penicillin-binding protein 5/6)